MKNDEQNINIKKKKSGSGLLFVQRGIIHFILILPILDFGSLKFGSFEVERGLGRCPNYSLLPALQPLDNASVGQSQPLLTSKPEKPNLHGAVSPPLSSPFPAA